MVVAKEIIWVLDWSFGLLSEHQIYILLVLWIRPLNSPFKLSQNWISIQSLPYSKFLLWAKTFNGIVVLHLSTLLVTSSSCCLNDRAIWLEPGTLKGLFEIVNISATIRLDSIGVLSKHNGPIYFRFKIILNSLSQFKYIFTIEKLHRWERGNSLVRNMFYTLLPTVWCGKCFVHFVAIWFVPVSIMNFGEFLYLGWVSICFVELGIWKSNLGVVLEFRSTEWV